LAGQSQTKMPIRNTPYETEKLAQLAAACPKLDVTIEKPEKYLLAGIGEDGVVWIRVSAYGLAAGLRLFRAEYSRLELAGLLPARQKAGRA
jgi:hypothetical protein